jgi:signal transduction histidine kinase
VSALLAKSLRSSTFKVALLCIIGFGVLVLALFSYVYLVTDAYVLSRSDRAIDADRVDLIDTYRENGQPGLVAAIDRLQAEKARADAVYLLADPSLGHVAGNLPAWPNSLQGAAGWGSFAGPDQRLNALDRPEIRASFETLSDGFHLLVGRNVSDLNRLMGRIHLALGLVILLVFIIAAFATLAITRRTVGRIESINEMTRAIVQSGLGTRVPLRGTRDEWDHLADNLNAMLDRIEDLVAEVKHVTDNVAHDLRTPLARVRGRLEKASFEPRDSNADQALINESMADIDGVLRMFASVTRISQVETTDRTAAFCSVDLVEIAGRVVELFDAAAELKHIDLAVAGDCSSIVTGDKDLLFDALANLVDNAINHGRKGGLVIVRVDQKDNGTVLSVCDDGPGIPADEFEHVFKRFYRLERSRGTPGNGLGLSLVAAVTRQHGARISLYDNKPGLKVEVHFPSIQSNGRAGPVADPEHSAVGEWSALRSKRERELSTKTS